MMKDGHEGFDMLKKIKKIKKKNCMEYLLSLGDLNNSNNSLIQINIYKRFNLDKLKKRNKLLFRKLKMILDINNINMRD